MVAWRRGCLARWKHARAPESTPSGAARRIGPSWRLDLREPHLRSRDSPAAHGIHSGSRIAKCGGGDREQRGSCRRAHRQALCCRADPGDRAAQSRGIGGGDCSRGAGGCRRTRNARTGKEQRTASMFPLPLAGVEAEIFPEPRARREDGALLQYNVLAPWPWCLLAFSDYFAVTFQ